MTSDLFRMYLPVECNGKTGYPFPWAPKPGDPVPAIKDIVREQAGHRCVRCGHPYRKGEHGNGEWSPCDSRCTHKGPMRLRPAHLGDEAAWVEHDLDAWETAAADARMDDGPDGYQIARYDIEAQWRILTVHHLDNVKANCRWWNLAALCQRCHLQIQGTVQMSRVWPWEHSEWFKPYVAGYYAWVYLNDDLTRPEVMHILDELLALELQAGDV